jgi:hypothetical protein
LAKAVKNVRQKVGLDSLPSIAYRDFDMRVHSLDDDVNSAMLRGKFERVCEEIPENLLEPISVSEHDPTDARIGGCKPDVLGNSGRPHRLDRGFHDCRQIQRWTSKLTFPASILLMSRRSSIS